MTSFPLTTFTTALLQMAPEIETDLVQADYEQAVKEALQSYSKQFPDTYTEDITGDGGKYYPVSGLAEWVEDFSTVAQIQYPAATIANDEQPQYLESDEYNSDYWAAQVRYIYFYNIAPAATEAFRILYTIPYVFAGTPSATDIPAQDFYALVKLAACFACRSVAVKYSLIGDSLVSADAASHTTKAQEFQNRADAFCAGYRADMGLPADPNASQVKAAGLFVDKDSVPPWQRGRRYLFHGGRP